jgi:hypothetical protein
MYLLVTDETNRIASDDIRFLVYGGLAIPLENQSALDQSIREIRANTGYQSSDELKFDTRARPDNVSIQSATEAKRLIVELCRDLGCKFIAHVIHHNVIKNQDAAEQIHKAADYVIGRFHMLLESNNADGICLMDNLSDRSEFSYITRKFQNGLSLSNNENVSLCRIKLFGSTCIGASHANSAVDIILGSFRYCINQPRNEAAAQQMLQNVVELMWSGLNPDGTISISNQGLIIRPRLQDIRSHSLRREYDALLIRLNELLNNNG